MGAATSAVGCRGNRSEERRTTQKRYRRAFRAAAKARRISWQGFETGEIDVVLQNWGMTI